MRILIAPDKFKGVQSAREVAENIAAGLRDVLSDVQIDIVPVADGGEGTAEVMRAAKGGSWRECRAHDALSRAIQCHYVWLPESATAVIEMSEAAGTHRLIANERNIDLANTFGVGEMILDAIKHGALEIIVGLGGSATNDGGFGMARALGFRFLDVNAEELAGAVSGLIALSRIERPKNMPAELPGIIAGADVRIPLLGKNGATHLFAPQKGARLEQIQLLEKALTKLAEVINRDLGVDFRNEPGAGAAGGVGFGLMSFGKATMRGGFDLVAEATGLPGKMKIADVVITGEGSLDRQTLEGKAPAEIARLARTFGKKVFAIVGRADEDPRLRDLFDGIYVAGQKGVSDEENIAHAAELLRGKARELAKAL